VTETRQIRLGRLFERRKILGFVDEPMLSVFREHGVVLKDDMVNHNQTAEDRSIYQLVEPGWLAVNRMKAWQGSLGVSAYRGIMSGHYICLAPRHSEHDRYLHYLLRSPRMTAYFASISRGVRPGQIEIDNDQLAATPLDLPNTDEQRRIADFLDDRVARIDQIITARQVQVALLDAIAARASYEAVTGANVSGERRSTDLAWLGDLPSEWPLLTVASQFQVDLGKMLDEKRQTGEHVIPYLRNTNVQWDTIDADDLKTMDIAPEERSRYTVKPGDLLVCEGGQPGRGAIWTGSLSPLGYQKALHRARTRGRSRPAWLLECLRTAVSLNVFAIENEQTTIGHLTNEQLRSLRFPFPDPEVQDRFLADVARTRTQVAQAVRALRTSTVRLAEFKQSLITAAVTGEIDVTTAASGVQG